MIDPRILRDEPDRVRAAQAKRGLSDEVVDRALAADEGRRRSIVEFEEKRAEQKKLGKLIPKAVPEEKADLLARTQVLAAGAQAAGPTQGGAGGEWKGGRAPGGE